MIDLHMHTNYSDGTCTVSELLKEADDKGLECISITDHDTCIGYEELKNPNVRNLYKGKIIPGCEFKSIVTGTTIEILGYNIDTDKLNKTLPPFEETYKKINIYETEKLYNIFKERGYLINKDAIHFDVKKESGCFTIINEVLSHPENNRFYAETNFNNVHEFYRIHMSNPKSPYFVDNSCLMPKPQEIVDLIHKVGGLAFIPHVYIYGENSQKVFETLTKDHLVDGIECYYSKFSNEQIEFLLEFCKQNKYFISGGSDYHGANKPEIHMGTGIQNNLRIPHDIVEKWAEFI